MTLWTRSLYVWQREFYFDAVRYITDMLEKWESMDYSTVQHNGKCIVQYYILYYIICCLLIFGITCYWVALLLFMLLRFIFFQVDVHTVLLINSQAFSSEHCIFPRQLCACRMSEFAVKHFELQIYLCRHFIAWLASQSAHYSIQCCNLSKSNGL